MGMVVTMAPYQNFWKRWIHKLFKCPTFWQAVILRKPAWTCPGCGHKGTCYWDGNDTDEGIDYCNSCAQEIESRHENHCQGC